MKSSLLVGLRRSCHLCAVLVFLHCLLLLGILIISRSKLTFELGHLNHLSEFSEHSDDSESSKTAFTLDKPIRIDTNKDESIQNEISYPQISEFTLTHVLHHNTLLHNMKVKMTTVEQNTLQSSKQRPTYPVKHFLKKKKAEQTLFHNTQFDSFSEKRVPDHTDPNTVLQFAYMSAYAYEDPIENDPGTNETDFYERSDEKHGKNYENPHSNDWNNNWNKSMDFGWQQDGIRGHVFSDAKRETMIIAFKGTSASLFGIGGGATSAKDKYNDNMMFSCCCAKVDVTWRPLCDCCESVSRQCSTGCVQRHASFADSYFNLAQTLVSLVQSMFPTATIWTTGHSLGGALASLTAIATQGSAISFEAPGDLLYAQRIGLVPPHFESVLHKHDFMQALSVFQFGNTGDPVFEGRCNGPASSCYFSGYAMESKCHTGNVGVYGDRNSTEQAPPNLVDPFLNSDGNLQDDTVTQHMDIRYHRLSYLIQVYLEKLVPVPNCYPETICKDCLEWDFKE